MPRQAWVFLLGAMALQACVCVSKTSASAQHPPSVNETTPNFIVTERVDGAEERDTTTIVKDLYNQIVGKTKFDLTMVTSPEFHDWYNKVMNQFRHSVFPLHVMADTCRRMFGLASFQRALNYAKRTLPDRTMVLALEDSLLKSWLRDTKMNAYFLYRLLELDDNGKTLTDLTWDTWNQYFKTRYPGRDPYDVLIAEGLERDSEKIFFAKFIMKRWRSDKRELAEVAIEAILTKWQHKKISEDGVYRMMMLEKTDAPLSSGVLRLWMLYTKRLGLDTNARLFSHLQKRYKVEADLANAIIAFETVGEGPLDGTLTENLLKHWSKLGKSPEDVFQLLLLDETKHIEYRLEMLNRFCGMSDSTCFNLDLLQQLRALLA